MNLKSLSRIVAFFVIIVSSELYLFKENSHSVT